MSYIELDDQMPVGSLKTLDSSGSDGDLSQGAVHLNEMDLPSPNTEGSHNGNSDSPSPATLTLRMIMQGKEAGSIIGKKGDNVKKFREESGAKINISDSSCPERIVTVTGTTDQIFKAFTMICKKFEEVRMYKDIQNTHQNSTLPKPPVTVRLIVPASQCGSLIGKGGSKIKEIREVTGASIQVASEMLPNSTERAVTISGTADAITQCIYHICCVMLESPPKGATIPYRPKPALPPVIFAGGQAFTVQGQYAIPQQPDQQRPNQQQQPDFYKRTQVSQQEMLTKLALQQGLLGQPMPLIQAQQGMLPANHTHPSQLVQGLATAQLPGAFPRQPAPGANNAQTHEMTIPNDLIGCIIGRGGAKINEIRQLSGATIKIANAEEGSSDRKVTVSGTPETINAAQYLINASIEMHKTLTLDPTATPTTSSAMMGTSAAPVALHINQLMKPVSLVGGLPSSPVAAAPFGMFDRKNFAAKMRGGTAPNMMAAQAAAAARKNGNKFAPY